MSSANDAAAMNDEVALMQRGGKHVLQEHGGVVVQRQQGVAALLGLGHIGSAIAHRLTGFDCAIAYHNRHELPESGYPYAPSAVDLARSVEVLVVAVAGNKGAPPLADREVDLIFYPEPADARYPPI